MSTEMQKRRLLHLQRILLEQTDEGHGLTMAQILDALAQRGVPAERKAVYRDLKALRDTGLDVRTARRPTAQYWVAGRPFSVPELMLLVDAVQGSRFLTKSKSDALVRAVRSLAPAHAAAALNRRVHVHGRIKMQNESVYGNVDVIQDAIARKRKVRFRYFTYDAGRQRVLRREGGFYEETPVHLVYSDGYYYLVAFDDGRSDLVHFRVDRMVDLALSDEEGARNEAVATFDVERYESRLFAMYAGEPVRLTLRVDDDAMGAVIDRFGRGVDAGPAQDGWARVHVEVTESPTLFGWLAQLGCHVRIEKPRRLARAYADYLRDIAARYD